MPKDLFSSSSDQYAAFRPSYPNELIISICDRVPDKTRALDVGTGNGQVAELLAEHFASIHATDLSPQQVAQSKRNSKVQYTVCPAEHTPFPDDHFSLITAAQCYHWFDPPRFWKEMRRIAKSDAWIAIWGYHLLRLDSEVDALIDDLYHDILGDRYWAPERKLVEERYESIDFPCEVQPCTFGDMTFGWTTDELLGYLGTWSAVRKYRKERREDPLATIRAHLGRSGEQGVVHQVRFPLFGKLGIIRA